MRLTNVLHRKAMRMFLFSTEHRGTAHRVSETLTRTAVLNYCVVTRDERQDAQAVRLLQLWLLLLSICPRAHSKCIQKLLRLIDSKCYGLGRSDVVAAVSAQRSRTASQRASTSSWLPLESAYTHASFHVSVGQERASC